MLKTLSWGRKCGFGYGMIVGISGMGGALLDPWLWLAIPIAVGSCILFSSNDVAHNGGVAYSIND